MIVTKQLAWAYNLADYESFFALTEQDKQGKILDCNAGATCFTAQMRRAGKEVIAFDPLYRLPLNELKAVFEQAKRDLCTKIHIQLKYDQWAHYFTLQEIQEMQEENIATFFEHFEKEKNYYCSDNLLDLPFEDQTFDLALCANFLCDTNYSPDFMGFINNIKTLARIAKEVRVFPLLDKDHEVSSYLPPFVADFQKDYILDIQEVPFDLQQNATEVLSIKLRC